MGGCACGLLYILAAVAAAASSLRADWLAANAILRRQTGELGDGVGGGDVERLYGARYCVQRRRRSEMGRSKITASEAYPHVATRGAAICDCMCKYCCGIAIPLLMHPSCMCATNTGLCDFLIAKGQQYQESCQGSHGRARASSVSLHPPLADPSWGRGGGGNSTN